MTVDFGSVSFGWAIYLLLLIYLGTLCLGGDAAAERGLYGLAFVLEDICLPEPRTGCTFVKRQPLA